MPCPRCGAVSDVTATTCYQCRGRLPGRGNIALAVVPQSAAEPPKPLLRLRAPAIVGTAILALIALVSYYSYRQAPQLGDRVSPEDAGVSPGKAMAGDMTPAKRNESISNMSPATVQSRRPLAGAAPAVVNPASEGRQQAESRTARVVTAPVTHTKGANEAGASVWEQSRPTTCTEAVAALGFCTLKPAQKTGAEAAVTIKPIIARPKAGDAGRAGLQEGRRQDSCTEGATALGLCAPRPIQEGK